MYIGSGKLVRQRCGVLQEIVTRNKKGMLRWFKHMERMSGHRMTKQICEARVQLGKLEEGIPTGRSSSKFVTLLERQQARFLSNMLG